MAGKRVTLRRGLAVLVTAAIAVGPATADIKDLLGRVPGDANVLVVVDVEQAMQSPMAVREGWASRRVSAYADKPLIVPPSTALVVMAAQLRPGDFEPLWLVSVMDLLEEPSIERIAGGEHGYVDPLGDVPAAWSPIGAYFVQPAPRILGVVAPANRQFAARWTRQKTVPGAFVSSYLRSAAGTIDRGPAVVMAMDLQDWTSKAKIRRTLDQQPLEALAGRDVDLDTLAEVLSSVQGVTLTVNIAEEARGQGVLDFQGDPALLAGFVKPLFLEVLGRFGAYLAGLENWEFAVKRNRLTFEGTLTTEDLRRLLSIVDPPSPLETAAAAEGAPSDAEGTAEGQAASKTDIVAAASLEYYQAISKMITQLQKNVGSGAKSAGLSQIASWMRRDSRRIQRLPILNVDPELLDWGAQVDANLNTMANIFGVGGMQTQVRTSSVTAADSGTYGYGDDYSRDHRRALTAQRQQAVAEEKAAALAAAQDVLQQLAASRAQIRAAMTNRYGMEFP